LHCMLRSQPCVGGNKRKFTLVSDGDEDRWICGCFLGFTLLATILCADAVEISI
jgi:hypothetical protein